jgi:hypothetical protein
MSAPVAGIAVPDRVRKKDSALLLADSVNLEKVVVVQPQ